MTRNQIEYSKLLETRRSNLSNEDLTRMRDLRSYTLGTQQLEETGRHNREQERQGRVSLDETARANRVREGIQQGTLDETRRSNQAQERLKDRELGIRDTQTQIQRDTLSETARANQAREALSLRQQQETERANQAREAETARHDRATESLTSQSIGAQYAAAQYATTQREIASQRQYALGLENVQLGREQLTEKTAHDTGLRLLQSLGLGMEAGRLSETIRHNQESESVSRGQLSLESSKLSETTRHNKVEEGIGIAKVVNDAAQKVFDRTSATLRDVIRAGGNLFGR